MSISKERLQQLLKHWEDKAAWHYRMEMQSAWVDNGKGCHIKQWPEYEKAMSKVEILKQLINETT